MKSYHIASVSWAKDSLWMLLELIDRGAPLDEVAFYDTGMEFNAIYETRDRMLPELAARGIKYTELKPEIDFIWKMFEKPVNSKKNGFHYGYSWCGGRCRWGTTGKQKALNDNAAQHTDCNVIQYIGIAADEPKRLERLPEGKVAPLAEWGITKAEALQNCYSRGFCWEENGMRLYDLLDRVSCWCCGNKNLKELRNMYEHLPEYWERLKGLQSRTSRPMKGEGKSVFDLEARFVAQQAREEAERRAREAMDKQLSMYEAEAAQ